MKKYKLLLTIFIICVFTVSSVNAAKNITGDIVSADENDNSIQIANEDTITSENNDHIQSSDEIDEDMLSTENANNLTLEDESQPTLTADESVESQGERSTSNHYGYWAYGADMYDINLTDMKQHGVTDIFLNYYAFTKYNESDVVSWIANANQQDIKVHIWAQIFYAGKWIRPVNNGVINYTFFEEKIKELTYYASLEGVGGVHYDYLRYSGSEAYNNSTQQNPGGMEAITLFVNMSTTAIRNVNPNIIISAAIMPEPDALKSWYGDDYEQISYYMDAIIPMVYTENYRQNVTWVKKTTQWFVDNSKGAEVWTGLQGYAVNDYDEEYISNTPVSQMTNEINAALDAGSKGAIVFKYGLSYDIDFINLPVDEAEYNSFNNLNYIISCSGRRINLNQDFAFNATYDADYKGGVKIYRNNLIINGNNHTIDGANMARMFNVMGKNIIFQNINFINGASDDGGAIYCNKDNLKIINCTFTNCKAEDDGGAVFAISANTLISNSRFINNTAVYNAGVYMGGENSAVIGSYFENNTAKTSAGAIGWANKPNGVIKDSKFVKNSALNEGGGAIFWNLGKNGKIINSTFENNYAIFYGGAIYFDSENGVISDSTFTQNTATVNGAAIHNTGKNAVINNSIFIANTAKKDSGIYSENNLKITNCSGVNVKIESSIAAKTKTFVINYAGTYSITLKDGSGNAISGETITFTLNGKKIGSSKTGLNGVATIKLTASILKTAKAGTKKLVIKANSAKFTSPTKTVNVIINKEKTKITAKNAVFKKQKKVKKYAIVLKNSKNKAIKKVKVTLKVNGKTYKAKTNSKGKAIFKINKLTKKSKFKAKIRFAGNNNYKPTTKTVKITVKN